MASVGVEFDRPSLDRCFHQCVKHYQDLKVSSSWGNSQWAIDSIYSKHQPVRPWALGEIKKSASWIYKFSGYVDRTPGLYKQTDPKTDLDKNKFLIDTNERIHSSVRVRLACEGLGLDDGGKWDCPSLSSNWKLKRSTEVFEDPIPSNQPNWGWDEDDDDSDSSQILDSSDRTSRWVWEYVGDKKNGPTDAKQRVMVEDRLGPYERHLLKLSGGTPNVYEFAKDRGGEGKGI